MQDTSQQYNIPEPMQEEDIGYQNKKREYPHAEIGGDTDMESPEIEQLRRRNREMNRELQENENERHHVKIEMERFEKLWEEER